MLSSSRLSTALRSGFLSADCGAVDNAALTGFCDAIAAAIVAEISGYAEAVVSVESAGLQTSTALGSPTAPPLVEQSLKVR